ncbi:MAG: Fur family transcriptional regulator [Syntrophobacteraceae bacterium]
MEQQTVFRITRQRRIMLDQIKMMKSHPTACQLYDAVRKKLPDISLATVYRNLELLAEKGLIGKIVTDGRQKRFDGNTEIHYHAHCLRCDAVIDIPDNRDIISFLRNDLKNPENFEILGARIELTGYCGTCATGGGAYKGRES